MDSALLKVESICRKNGLRIEEDKVQQLSRFVELLLEWNSKINLISRADVANVWFSHVLHSLSLLFVIDFPRNAAVIDLGTGGGLPGIPLAILRDDIQMTLLDSIRKKTMVVQDVVKKLALKNVHVVTGRAEDLGRQKEFAHSFNIVVSRATASLTDLVKWSQPLLKEASGDKREISDQRVCNLPCLIAFKGGDLGSEIEKAAIKVGMKQHSIINLAFDGSEELGLHDKKLVIVPFQ